MTLPEPLTPMQIRALQTREYDASFEDAYKSAITVLQDRGFNLQTSDYNAGVIQGSSGWKNSPSYLSSYLNAVESSKHNASLTLEPLSPERTLLRISVIQELSTERTSLTPAAAQISNDKSVQITDAVYYQSWFQDIQSEVYRRQSQRKSRGYQPPVSSQPIYVAPPAAKSAAAAPILAAPLELGVQDLKLIQKGLAKEGNFSPVTPEKAVLSDKFKITDKLIIWFAHFESGQIAAEQAKAFRFKAIWYQPSGKIYQEDQFTFPAQNAQMPLLLVWNSLFLNAAQPEIFRGEWQLEIRIQDKIFDQRKFSIE